MDRVSTHIWRTELFICYIDCVWPCVYALPLSTEKKEKSSPSIFISYHIHIMHCKENYINSRMYNYKVWNSSMFFVHFLIICFPLFRWFIFRGSAKWRKQFWWSKIDNRWLCCVNIVASIFITAHKQQRNQRSEAWPWNKNMVNETLFFYLFHQTYYLLYHLCWEIKYRFVGWAEETAVGLRGVNVGDESFLTIWQMIQKCFSDRKQEF